MIRVQPRTAPGMTGERPVARPKSSAGKASRFLSFRSAAIMARAKRIKIPTGVFPAKGLTE
jgi:hypothetical protein